MSWLFIGILIRVLYLNYQSLQTKRVFLHVKPTTTNYLLKQLTHCMNIQAKLNEVAKNSLN